MASSQPGRCLDRPMDKVERESHRIPKVFSQRQVRRYRRRERASRAVGVPRGDSVVSEVLHVLAVVEYVDCRGAM